MDQGRTAKKVFESEPERSRRRGRPNADSGKIWRKI